MNIAFAMIHVIAVVCTMDGIAFLPLFMLKSTVRGTTTGVAVHMHYLPILMSWKSFLGWKQVCRHLSTLKTNLGQNVLTSRPRFRGSAPQPARLPPPSPLVQACPCPLRDAPHLSRPDTSATAEGRCEHASKTGIYKPFVIRELKPPSPAQQLDGFARGNSPQEQLRPEGLRTTASSST